MRLTYTKVSAETAIRGRVEYIVPWHPQRVKWIKCRNKIIDALRFFGLPIEARLNTANKIMNWGIVCLFAPRWRYLYDRKGITKVERFQLTNLIRKEAYAGQIGTETEPQKGGASQH